MQSTTPFELVWLGVAVLSLLAFVRWVRRNE